MKQKRNKDTGELTDKEINQLFEQFSRPIVQPCVTSQQKQSAVGIAKILWLRFVTGTDTEENIYEDLRLIFKDNHDSNIAMGSLYFFKMKTELTEAQIGNLKKHYSDERNLNRLENWESPVS
jgi:folylpolyglutamate synthase/dihydropteroate synthase